MTDSNRRREPERVEELVGSKIEEIRVDGGLAYLYVTHRGTDDEACTLLVRIPEIEWVYPSEKPRSTETDEGCDVAPIKDWGT